MASILFAIMWLVFFDVFARYLFNAPIPSARELSQIGLAAVVFCALPLVAARGEHVEVDFVYHVLTNTRVRALYRAVISLLCPAACFVLALQSLRLGRTMLATNEESAYLHFPLGYVAYGIGLMIAIAALAHVAAAVPHALARGRDTAEGSQS